MPQSSKGETLHRKTTKVSTGQETSPRQHDDANSKDFASKDERDKGISLSNEKGLTTFGPNMGLADKKLKSTPGAESNFD